MLHWEKFCSPICRSHYSIQEFCKEIGNGRIEINNDKVVLITGIGWIYKLDMDELWVGYFHLINQILRVRLEAHINCSTVLPQIKNEWEALPYISTYNRNLQDVVQRMQGMGKPVFLIQSHSLFMTGEMILDEVSGYQH